jgi:hypothetical protein
MANNRLYLVDKETKEYVILAKGWGNSWSGSLLDSEKHRSKIIRFLESRFCDNDHNSNIIIGHENDEVFYNNYILNGVKV